MLGLLGTDELLVFLAPMGPVALLYNIIVALIHDLLMRDSADIALGVWKGVSGLVTIYTQENMPLLLS